MFPVYIVRKPFRNYGEVKLAGSLIDDPATIKHFKSLLADNHIVGVEEHTLARYEEFFKVRYNVSIKKAIKDAEEAKSASDVKVAKVTEKAKVPQIKSAPTIVANIK